MTKYFPNSHLWSPVNSPVEKMTYLWAGHQQLSAGISLNLQHIWRRYDTSALLDDSASSPRKLIKNDEAYVVFFSMIVWWKPNLFPESKSFHIFIRITEWSIPIWSSFKVQIPRKKLDYNRLLIYIYVVNAVLLKVRHINCISPGTTSPELNSNRIHTDTIPGTINATVWARSC